MSRPRHPLALLVLGLLAVACGRRPDDADGALPIAFSSVSQGLFVAAELLAEVSTRTELIHLGSLPFRAAEEAEGVHLDTDDETLYLRASGTFLLPLAVSATTRSLELDRRQSGATLSLSTLDLDARWTDLTPGETTDGRISVSLESLRDSFGWVLFQVTIEEPDGVLALRSLRLVADRATAPPAAPVTAAPPPKARPHIVLIVLDAARADHFGAYGYPRDTTPNLDRLAADALAFESAFAECASTSCSIPNLITGLPFLDIAAVRDERRIDDRVATLAELLGDLGYHTVGISASPNNSVARNSHQGYEEFQEIWREVKSVNRTDPHLLSQRAVEAIGRSRDDDRPLFLMLHYVPPHEPYDPPPRFDLFTDPEYRGPIVNSSRETTRDLRAGKLALSAADIAQLMALYDGNLRRADDAVEEVLAALRDQAMWQDSIVLVTSDHGEAFFEHGLQGHNSTCFDEMLHVPFILRLPVPPSGEVDTRRLVSLTDAVPTILGRLGVEPAAGAVGRDLLAPTPATRHRRVIFHRTGNVNNPTFAARTLQWKAIVQPEGFQRSLFDLAADPGEIRNLAAKKPLFFVALCSLIADYQALAGQLGFHGEAMDLPPEDAEMLRALGYL